MCVCVCVCVCVCKGDSPPNSDGSVVRAVMGDGGAFKEAANPVQGLGRLSQRKGIPVLSSEGRRGHWAQKPRRERGCGVLREEQIPCEKEKRERQAGEVSRGQPAGLGGMATNPDCVLRQQEEPRTDSHFLLQGIFPTQESNPGLLHCRQILYRLDYEGLSPLESRPHSVPGAWLASAPLSPSLWT